MGFRQEGVLRENEFFYGHYVDHVLYSILRGEWK
jgi:ribosomal-protein-serine acetyltransferase